jgi:hypothetical protein
VCRSIPQLAQLAAALAEVLAPAVEPLRQMLTTVLRQPADPAAVGSVTADGAASSVPGVTTLQSLRSQSLCSSGSLELSTESTGCADGGGGKSGPASAFNLQACGYEVQKPEWPPEEHQRNSSQPAAVPLHRREAMNPFWLQYGSKQQEAAFAEWDALQNWQVSVRAAQTSIHLARQTGCCPSALCYICPVRGS